MLKGSLKALRYKADLRPSKVKGPREGKQMVPASVTYTLCIIVKEAENG